MLDSFDLELPDGWANQTAYQIIGPVENDQAPLLTLTLDREPVADDLDEFADARVAMLEDAFGQMEILKNENITLDNGIAAREFIFKLSLGEAPVYRKHIWILHNDTGYDFVGDFAKHTLKTYGVDMLRIAGTLKTA